MNRRILYLFSIIAVYILVLAPAASANHHVWLVMDSNKQLSGMTGDESRASWWMINGAVTTYKSNSTTISSNVTTAVNNWNAQIPQVRITGTGSDLVFDYSDSVCAVGSGGCHSIASVYNDTTRKANFTLSSNITITSSSSNKTRTAAHEIGHYLGLHERYRDDGSTGDLCNSENTIMNGGGCDTNTGPTSLDKSRMDNFMGSGYANNVLPVLNASGIVTVTWDDYAYGELHYRVRYQKNVSGAWSTISTSEVTMNTGLVASASWKSPPLKPQSSLSLSSYGKGSYRVEITPYFKSYDKYGVVTYSSSFTYYG
ncbi:hypothetical protein L1N85_26880 [Paenibacillus alkaliterrae]|uniref:zinc-dependent metalloprotease family protein n=1 Tax=Paenibacillus alkaliterrae TaxID=320909 RepID=UPI001F320E32|nr:zinc-dependent metalloprotease family protein [Paenibacillus alkaliterrae]MCF2941944.1 hypothetical protein [Paenibacillus alkaliterrae]